MLDVEVVTTESLGNPSRSSTSLTGPRGVFVIFQKKTFYNKLSRRTTNSLVGLKKTPLVT